MKPVGHGSRLDAAEIPGYLASELKGREILDTPLAEGQSCFSLAGVQLKFPMRLGKGRFRLPTKRDGLGEWIIKTPSQIHPGLALNEYSAMRMAQLAGVEVHEFRLVEMSSIADLPPLNYGKEEYGYAIRRFDRVGGNRIHSEDMAQVLFRYPHEKYDSANYDQLGKVIYRYSSRGLEDIQQFSRRLLVNILLANGDAHLKNWSLVYPDRIHPRPAPAYDIVSTRAYMGDERRYALNMGSSKNWYTCSFDRFQLWAKRADIPWRTVKPHLVDTLERARESWPTALQDLPMLPQQKATLKEHWKNLAHEFRL